MSVERDPERERRLFCVVGPLAAWRRHASERLEAGEREYGNSWAPRPLEELLWEIMEECADVGAWAALALQALELRSDLGDGDREFVSKALQDAARYGAWGYARSGNARKRIVEAKDGGDGC